MVTKKRYFLISKEHGKYSELLSSTLQGLKIGTMYFFIQLQLWSWETVRNLDRMSPLVLIIRNLCTQGGAPKEVMENLEDINEIREETLEAFPN